MTDEAVREIVRIRERIAQLEARLAPKEEPMYRTEPTDQDAIQQQLRAYAWRHDPQLEQLVERLERNPDDPAIAGSLRMQVGYYRQNKEAARRAGRPVDGREGVQLDTRGDDPR